MKPPFNETDEYLESEVSDAPHRVIALHTAIAQQAAKIIAEFPQHAPLVFLDPGTPAGYAVDMRHMFIDAAGKQRAIEIVRQIVRDNGYEEVCFVCEATELVLTNDEIIPPTPVGNPEATDILAITVERPGALYCWSHAVTVLDDGSRTMSPEYRFLKHTPGGMGQVAFLFLPENYERESASYAKNN